MARSLLAVSRDIDPRVLEPFEIRQLSLAVTHAAITNWEYMDIIRRYAEPKCSEHLQKSIETIDKILDTRVLATPLKALFGVHGLRSDKDFASLIEVRLGYRRMDQLYSHRFHC